jgi:hypothetical protein
LTTSPPPELAPSGTRMPPAVPVPDPVRTAAKFPDIVKPAGGAEPPIPSVEPPPVAKADLIQKADRNELEVKNSKASIDFVTLFISVFAVLGVLSAAGLLISMGRRAMRGNARFANSPAKRRSRLDQLLHKELETVVEPVTIPPGQSFFGRAVGPQRNRVDDGHPTGELHRPHIDAHAATEAGNDGKSPGLQATFRRTDGPESAAPASQAAVSAGGRRAPSRVQEEELG